MCRASRVTIHVFGFPDSGRRYTYEPQLTCCLLMVAKLYRTGVTSLTDDELLILDVIFSAGAMPRSLSRQYFKEQWNAEPHKLEDRALAETLRTWLKSGIISQTPYEHR